MTKVLVTGAGGFIGSHMVNLCVAKGYHVIGVDKKPLDEWILPTRKAVHFFDNFNIAKQDLGYDFDVCFHMAAESRIQPSFSNPYIYVESNVVGTAKILEQAKRCGGVVVYAGSSTADDDILKNIYATTKHQGEDLCRAYYRAFGIPVVVTRFYNVYGPNHIREGRYATVVGIFEKQYENDLPLTVTGDGAQRRDFTHVADIIQG
ncbi:MAG: NAD-dependent epimerase/dehydratase family protein, partial [Candidatus Lokiarchaeota archaeon]|nr:NAD-dependent epimerase/dehydratase family protein [Candidatus Lokiarchaeota archaeon]